MGYYLFMKIKSVDIERRNFLRQGVRSIALGAFAWGAWSGGRMIEARKNNSRHFFSYKPKKIVEGGQKPGTQKLKFGGTAEISDVFEDWRQDKNDPNIPVRLKIKPHDLSNSTCIVSPRDDGFFTGIAGVDGEIRFQVENGKNPPKTALGQYVTQEEGYAYFYLDLPKSLLPEAGKNAGINEITFERKSYDIGTQKIDRWEITDLVTEQSL